MDRFERDPRTGTQQTRDDTGVPGNLASSQGQGKSFHSSIISLR